MRHGRCGTARKPAVRTFCGELVARLGADDVVRVYSVRLRQTGRSYVKCPNCLGALDRMRKSRQPPASAPQAPPAQGRLRFVALEVEIELGAGEGFPSLPLFGKGGS